MTEGRILIVDDEPGVCEVCALYLRRELFDVQYVHRGDLALDAIADFQPDLVVLDLMLPGKDGWEICREVRQGNRAHRSLPIIMLTARDAPEDRIVGLELGADDYLVKPFNPRELVARVRAVLRRARTPDGELAADPSFPGEAPAAPGTGPGSTTPARPPRRERHVFSHGGILLDVEFHQVWVDGREVSLTPKEFDLLHCFMQRPGKTFTRTELLERLWGYDYFGDERTVDVHIKRLRRKIEPPGDAPRYIHTVWGVGYRFGER